ncbi:MAG TPA: M28 family peptidase [Solirubrobacteraceae bacterium]|nr:M28 family peptidase [Solirubrobacteraceae bacterium]
MLDPRIYRMGLMVVVVAVIVVAFSLGNQAAPLSASLVPDAFDGQNAYTTMQTLAAEYPDRPPGSYGDNQIADYVASSLKSDGFLTGRSVFTAQTVDGSRTVQTVTGTLAGSNPGTIVVVAHRDSTRTDRSGSPSELSGTAVLLELARDLAAQTQQRTVVLASTSASVGAAGAQQLARTLPGQIDAVIVLGDMTGLEVRSPIVVPWSDSQLVAPPLLRNTVASAISEQTNINPTSESLGGQFLHLAFPLAATEQRPFADSGEPAVLVSSSGARLPAPDEPTSQAQITGFGRAILETVTALGAGPNVPGPSSYLSMHGELIPAWAVRLLVLALIVPVLLATIDGLARARRRGYRVARWAVWVLTACVPFALAALAVVALRVAGVIDAAPPGPVGGDAITLTSRAVAILAGLICLIAAAFALRWVLGRRLWSPRPADGDAADVAPMPLEHANGRPRRHRTPVLGDAASPGAASAFLLVMCVVALFIWVENPFAAALLVPALHAWMWIVAPEDRLRTPWLVLLFLIGLVPGALAVYYYAAVLGLGPATGAWNAVLMLAGGDVSLVAALEWSVVLGCVVSLALMIVRIARQPRPADAPVTTRGPITYAGPGSLGATGSAVRR